MASAVRDLELDLDAFEGPFDLLLTLLLKDAIQPSEIDMAGIVVAFVERLAERDELDLDACGEFLVLIAALLELKARHLFPDEEAELSELEPEEAAEELARRLAEYRRMKHAAVWLRERLDERRDLYFRLGPAPLAPTPERRLAQQEPLRLVEAIRGLAVEPPHVSISHLALRFPPVSQFVERFRAVLLGNTSLVRGVETTRYKGGTKGGELSWDAFMLMVYLKENLHPLAVVSAGPSGEPVTNPPVVYDPTNGTRSGGAIVTPAGF